MPAILSTGIALFQFQWPVELTQTEQVSIEDFERALQEFDVGKIPSQVKLSGIMSNFAYQNGIPAPALITLLNAVTLPNHLDQASITAIIKGLYPSTKVPSAHIFTIVNALGQGKQKPSPVTQNLLLRWIIMVQDVLAEPTVLIKLYSVFFNLLDMISIRASLCHILSITTSRKHVRPFRIQMLLELSKNFVSEPALVGLLNVYKEYCPDVIVGQSVAGKSSIFQNPDPEWRNRLHTLQDIAVRATDACTNTTSFKVVRRGVKMIRTAVVPEVHTFCSDKLSTTLEDVNGIADFVENLDRLVLPNQLVSILEDPLLRHYVTLNPNHTDQRRIDDWMSILLDARMPSQGLDSCMSEALVEVLEKVLHYVRYSKHIPKSVSLYLLAFLPRWNGKDNRDIILGLLAYLPIVPFEELQQSTLAKIEFAVLDNTIESAVALLDYYTTLVRHWTTTLLSLPDPDSPGVAEMMQSFAALVDYSSLLSLSLLASYTPTQRAISTVLSYHETLVHTISHAVSHAQIRILTPFTETIYLLVFFNPTLSTLSRLCHILATYKGTFEAAMSKPPPGSKYEYPRAFVSHFNGFLMDICNLLWRSRAFNGTDTNALGCLLPPAILPPIAAYLDMLTPRYALQAVFSLSHHLVLSGLSTAAIRDLEAKAATDGRLVRTRHIGPVTQRSLEALAMDGGIKVSWADYRLGVLRWLGERGVAGIGVLMSCTMKQLMATKITAAR
ncbi:hypothetical protein MMC26_004521 [Xylographa opegraphella]|nr:hypothetical protein [Xylographa opegraphella]